MTAQARFAENNACAWWVQVQGKAYGPYPPAQILTFVEQGRIKPHTLVSIEPTGGWIPAQQAGLIDVDEVSPGLLEPQPKLRGTSSPEEPDARHANLVIWGELPSGGEAHITSTLENYGASARIGANLWVLRTVHPVSTVRAAIAAELSVGERFLVIDASRGRLAWSNLGLDAETNLRRVWDGRG